MRGAASSLSRIRTDLLLRFAATEWKIENGLCTGIIGDHRDGDEGAAIAGVAAAGDVDDFSILTSLYVATTISPICLLCNIKWDSQRGKHNVPKRDMVAVRPSPNRGGGSYRLVRI